MGHPVPTTPVPTTPVPVPVPTTPVRPRIISNINKMFYIEPTVIRIALKEYLYNKYFCSDIFLYLLVIAGQKAGPNLPTFYLGHPGGVTS